jgi:hypothetical protein
MKAMLIFSALLKCKFYVPTAVNNFNTGIRLLMSSYYSFTETQGTHIFINMNYYLQIKYLHYGNQFISRPQVYKDHMQDL